MQLGWFAFAESYGEGLVSSEIHGRAEVKKFFQMINIQGQPTRIQSSLWVQNPHGKARVLRVMHNGHENLRVEFQAYENGSRVEQIELPIHPGWLRGHTVGFDFDLDFRQLKVLVLQPDGYVSEFEFKLTEGGGNEAPHWIIWSKKPLSSSERADLMLNKHVDQTPICNDI